MRRRDFCKLLAAAAASRSVPSYGQSSQESRSQPGLTSTRRTTPSSAHCRRRRGFSIRSATARSSKSGWMSRPGNLLRGTITRSRNRSQADFGMMCPCTRQSRILRATVRFNPPGIRCSSTKRRIGTRMPSSASGLTGVRSALPKPGTGTHAICISRTSGNTNINSNIIGPPSRFGYKDLCAQWTLLNWDPDELITRYKNAGAKIFIASGQSS